MRVLRRAAIDDQGVSLVEFALVVPVLLLLLVGILDFARAVNAYVTIGNAAREGTHYIEIYPTAVPSAIASAVVKRVVPLDGTNVTVAASFYDGATFQPWPANPTPNPSPVVTPVRVTVSYPWSSVAFMARFFPGGAGATFSASSTVDVVR